MYRAPVNDILHALDAVGMGEAIEAGRLGDLDRDTAEAILEEAGKFAAERVAPLRRVGDTQGTKYEAGEVTMPEGHAELYSDWWQAGWNSLSGSPEHGGQGLPEMIAVAALEMWNSGSIAFTLGPTLTMGAAEALEKHGSEDLKARYLEKLVTGEWMGTMNLTEPHAGSDLGTLRTRAEPLGDGRYRIFGQKIYITYGEHDQADNIVHMVLARLPDAPEGTRGISLFLVPKYLPNEDGSLGGRNDVYCNGVEHKLGIHASPTCTMIYGDGKWQDGNGLEEPGAIGWLVGEANRGLFAMFTMMNNARLAVAMQGVAVAEAAYQLARDYADQRTQGKAATWEEKGMAPIVHHPDVRRNLLTMRALTGAARHISYANAHAIDMARHFEREGDEVEAKRWRERVGILVPIAKAFATDVGVEVAGLGVQVHGGMGYVEETGAAQLLRDARIAPIYEGTNGIQAIDLVQRKLQQSDGTAVRGYIDELRAVVDEVRASNRPAFGRTAERLNQALDDLGGATDWLLEALGGGRTGEAQAGATPYLRLFGLASGGTYLAKSALMDAEGNGRTALARFMAENLVPETGALRLAVTEGADSFEGAMDALKVA